MKKILFVLVAFILAINVMGLSVEAVAERPNRVYGVVTVDGNSLEDATIRVKNLDRGTEETTTTNDNGSYEVIIMAGNNDEMRVEVNYKDKYVNSKEFEIVDHNTNYEINFEFESSPITVIGHKVVDLFLGFDVYSFLVYTILILTIIILIMKMIKISR